MKEVPILKLILKHPNGTILKQNNWNYYTKINDMRKELLNIVQYR